MATQSQGIQQLLAAEKKAAEIVADARKSNSFFKIKKYGTLANYLHKIKSYLLLKKEPNV